MAAILVSAKVSVFCVLFAYFDESMGSIGGYEPWKSCKTVDITNINKE